MYSGAMSVEQLNGTYNAVLAVPLVHQARSELP